MRNVNGDRVDLLPLALTIVMEDIAGAHQFQLIQTAPDALGARGAENSGASSPSAPAAAPLRSPVDLGQTGTAGWD